jgi:hypothetical protein
LGRLKFNEEGAKLNQGDFTKTVNAMKYGDKDVRYKSVKDVHKHHLQWLHSPCMDLGLLTPEVS